MPKLRPIAPIEARSPQYQPRNVNASLPGEAAANLGNAVSNIGGAIGEMAQKEVDLQQGRQVLEATTKATLDAKQWYQKLLDTPQDDLDAHVGLADATAKGLKVFGDQYRKTINSPEGQLAFDKTFEGLTTSMIVDAQHQQRTREISASKATVDNTMEALANFTANSTGQQMDAGLAMAHGTMAWAANVGIITPDDANKQLAAWRRQVYTSKVSGDIERDPLTTAKDLASGKYPDLTPVQQAEFLKTATDQVTSNQLRAQKVADEAAKAARETAVSNMTSQALSGQLSHPQLEKARVDFNIGREDYEHIFDLINKPLQQSPSDPATFSNVQIAVHQTPPVVSDLQLGDLYRTGKLNLDDYTKFRVDLAKVLKGDDNSELGKRKTLAQQVINISTSADPTIHQAALTDLANSSSFTLGVGDPIAQANEIALKYKPTIDALGGVTKTAATSQFNSSVSSYQTLLRMQQSWNTYSIFSLKNFETNPYDGQVAMARAELLNKARVAGRVVGAAPTNSIENSQFVQKSTGRLLMVLDGQLVAQ